MRTQVTDETRPCPHCGPQGSPALLPVPGPAVQSPGTGSDTTQADPSMASRQAVSAIHAVAPEAGSAALGFQVDPRERARCCCG